MRDAAVSKLVGDLTQRELIIKQKFFYLFDLLADDVLLQRYPFNGREQGAEVIIFVMKALRENV